MPSNLLLTLDEFKRRVDPVNADWSVAESDAAERIIEGVSRAVEVWCGGPYWRHFYSKTATTRYFTGEAGDYLVVPDLQSITTLKHDADGDRTYEITWATTDYDLWPYNASELSRPYTELRVAPQGRYSFPTGAKSIQIAGTWGWSSVPPEVVEAVYLESARVWALAHSPSGMASNTELDRWIAQARMHPEAMLLLEPFRRNIVAGAV